MVGASGGFNLTAGADWLIDALRIPGRYGVIQPVGTDPLALFLLRRLEMSSRIYVEESVWTGEQLGRKRRRWT